MSKSFERELINYFLSSGKYRIYELEREHEGQTIWMLHGSFEQLDEIAVFVNSNNFTYARERLEQYINTTYVGNKGVSVCFVVLATSKDELITREMTELHSDFVAATSMIQVDLNNLQVSQCIGASYAIQITTNFVQYQNSQKSSSESFSQINFTNAIILVDIIVFLIMVLSSGDVMGSLWSINDKTLLAFGAESVVKIKLGEYYRLFTPIFLHSGLLHIVLNMYALKALGSLIEKIYGTAKFAVIYFVSGIMGCIFSFTFSSYTTSVGASGAIFGLLGAAVVYGIRMKNRIGKSFLSSVFQVIVINLFLGFSVVSNIDNAAHIGGLVGGLLSTAAIELGSKKEQ